VVDLTPPNRRFVDPLRYATDRRTAPKFHGDREILKNGRPKLLIKAWPSVTWHRLHACLALRPHICPVADNSVWETQTVELPVI
jgi:hypothetical protein